MRGVSLLGNYLGFGGSGQPEADPGYPSRMEAPQQGAGQETRSSGLCLDHRSEIQAPYPFARREVPLDSGEPMSGWLDDDSGDSGPGLGVGMLLGGALTWLFGGGRTEYVLPDDE